MRVTLAVPALNEEERIERCLAAVRAMRVPRETRLSVVLIDDGSVDRTVQLAAPYVDDVIVSDTGNSYLARNYAAERTDDPVIIFLDADCVPSSDLFVWSVHELVHGAVAGTARKMPLDPRPIDRAIWSLYDRVDRLHEGLCTSPYTFFASYSYFDRSVFIGSGGFRASEGVSADWNLGRRLRETGRIAYTHQEHILFDVRRYRSVGYLRYWWRTRTNTHHDYPPGSELT